MIVVVGTRLSGLAVDHDLPHASVAFDQDGIVAVAARLGAG